MPLCSRVVSRPMWSWISLAGDVRLVSRDNFQIITKGPALSVASMYSGLVRLRPWGWEELWEKMIMTGNGSYYYQLCLDCSVHTRQYCLTVWQSAIILQSKTRRFYWGLLYYNQSISTETEETRMDWFLTRLVTHKHHQHLESLL